MSAILRVCLIVTLASVGAVGNSTGTEVGTWLFDQGPNEAENWCIVDQGPHRIHGVVRGSPGGDGSYRFEDDVPVPSYDGNSALNLVGDGAGVIEIPHHSDLSLHGDFTIQFWVRFSEADRDVPLISKLGDGVAGTGYSLMWDSATQKLYFEVRNGTQRQTCQSGRFSPTPGRWYHLAVIRSKFRRWSHLQFVVDGEVLRFPSNLMPGVVPAANAEPVRIGSAGTAWDELSIVATALDFAELSWNRSLGPGRRVFGEGFETYSDNELPWNRGGPFMNQWRRIGHAGGGVRWLWDGPRRTGRGSLEISLAGDATTPYGNSIAYYRFPLALIDGASHIGFEGWVSFESLDGARLFFLSEVFTGRVPPIEQHYGRTESLIAGGIQYNSRTRTWQWERRGGEYPYTDFSEPVDYVGGIDIFHYFKLVVDFEAGRYVTFQFDDQVWDLNGHDLLIFDPDSDHDPTPAMYEFNVRLITYDEYDGPFACRVVVDDVAVTKESP